MDPSLCANGCGFYGSASNNNLCSRCYKDYLKENITKSSINDEDFMNLKRETEKLKAIKIYPITDQVSDAVAAISLTDSSSIIKNKKNRCKSCNKKVGLTGFNCRCGDLFCGMHRYPEVHECQVDLKEIGRQILDKQNPLCMADKLEHRI